MITHQQLPLGGLEALGVLPEFSPTLATYVRPPGCVCGGGVVYPRHGRAGFEAPEVEQKISYMGNKRAVKVTYWGLIFFCVLVSLFDVSRRLGLPSGGLCGRRGVIWDGWRGLGRRP